MPEAGQKKVSIRIDGELVQLPASHTILQAAAMAGRFIPTLCHFDGLADAGACRLCVVEVSGVARLLPACTTPVQEGMSVVTDSPKLAAYRRMILELLLAERNHVCAVCVSNGHCELQNLAAQLGVASVRYPYRYPKLPVDLSHPRFVLDQNRCILCSRCVRVCASVEGAHVWNVMSRGIHSMVVADLNDPWGDASSCTGCGKCVNACPTGALSEKGQAVEEMMKNTAQLVTIAMRKAVRA
ncbi:MAG: bidirectional hydrogenase complex protein HoxU [Bryobacterales bacterium]|nr:bidirectional hydrogenase complex protein HoxU [Bryobacterales bacterium]